MHQPERELNAVLRVVVFVLLPYGAGIKPGNPATKLNRKTSTEPGGSSEPQLYRLTTYPGERTNVAAQHPNLVQQLQEQFDALRQCRTAP